MSIRFKCDKFEMGIKALDKFSGIQEKGFLRKLCFSNKSTRFPCISRNHLQRDKKKGELK